MVTKIMSRRVTVQQIFANMNCVQGYLMENKVVQMAKNLLAMWETQVGIPGWEDPLEKEMAIHSSILAWRTHGQEGPGRL